LQCAATLVVARRLQVFIGEVEQAVHANERGD
jgi:hypothetical protein